MRVLVLDEVDCFEGMGPARLGAWLEAGGGKFNRDVDTRALRLLRLPAEPSCLLKVCRLLASCADLPCDVAAAALGCEPAELLELVGELESDDGTHAEAPPEAVGSAALLPSKVTPFSKSSSVL